MKDSDKSLRSSLLSQLQNIEDNRPEGYQAQQLAGKLVEYAKLCKESKNTDVQKSDINGVLNAIMPENTSTRDFLNQILAVYFDRKHSSQSRH